VTAAAPTQEAAHGHPPGDTPIKPNAKVAHNSIQTNSKASGNMTNIQFRREPFHVLRKKPCRQPST
jgi:hypothetical protein